MKRNYLMGLTLLFGMTLALAHRLAPNAAKKESIPKTIATSQNW